MFGKVLKWAALIGGIIGTIVFGILKFASSIRKNAETQAELENTQDDLALANKALKVNKTKEKINAEVDKMSTSDKLAHLNINSVSTKTETNTSIDGISGD